MVMNWSLWRWGAGLGVGTHSGTMLGAISLVVVSLSFGGVGTSFVVIIFFFFGAVGALLSG